MSALTDARLSDILTALPDLEVSHLRDTDFSDIATIPTFLQGGADVHGSHGLFYWLRARGSGSLVRSHGCAVVLSWRADVNRLTAFRPTGEPREAADLLSRLAEAAAEAVPHSPLVARYCGAGIEAALTSQGCWVPLEAPWSDEAYADDETFPEVIVTTEPRDVPSGQAYKSIREAIFKHGPEYTYTASGRPLGIGEAEFIAAETARSQGYGEHESGFNDSVLSFLDTAYHDQLTYHYLQRDGRVHGFAITANTTGIAHGYYLGAADLPRLATYFLWQIYLQVRRSGAFALNLGGSEEVSLFQFKTRTFPHHVLQRSAVLQYTGAMFQEGV